MTTAYEKFFADVANKLKDEAKDFSIVTVRTYVLKSKGTDGKSDDSQLVAETAIHMLDGDTDNKIPVDSKDEINQQLLDFHREAVNAALNQRAETIANIGKALQSLIALVPKK